MSIVRVEGPPPVEVLESGRHYHARGGARDFMAARDVEVLLDGPKGTGKSRAVLERLHLIAQRVPGARILIARKTRASLTDTVLVTFEEKVLSPAWRQRLGTDKPARAWRREYVYPKTDARVVCVGLDRPSRLQSGEFDVVYVAEATELLESDVEMLVGLLRNGARPLQQLFLDCNPSYPRHWLNQRCLRGTTRRIRSRHQDNPLLWDAAAGDWTPFGRDYMDKLDRLTGHRRARLRDGVWASAEGMVYDEWRPGAHVIEPFEVPADWARIWSVDFGFTNPFVWQEWRQDHDGRLFLSRELYRTHGLVEDHAAAIREYVEGDPKPVAVICDHDAEDRATLERHLGVRTRPAYKAVGAGIQAVQARLRAAGDGKPRLFIMSDTLIHRPDPRLVTPEDGPPMPARTLEEVEGYVWDAAKDAPVKAEDHGLDAMRYVVAYVDKIHQRSAGGVGPSSNEGWRRTGGRPIAGGVRSEAW